jgi:hypothetical protein
LDVRPLLLQLVALAVVEHCLCWGRHCTRAKLISQLFRVTIAVRILQELSGLQ